MDYLTGVREEKTGNEEERQLYLLDIWSKEGRERIALKYKELIVSQKSDKDKEILEFRISSRNTKSQVILHSAP